MENGYSWERYQKHLYTNEALGLSLDYSCIHFSEEYLQEMEPRIEQAFCKMQELERGELANLDEQRMVGHYWLRNAALAPRKEISTEIGQTYEKIKEFGRAIKAGDIVSGTGQLFSRFLLIGIGGSALGPQLICDTLGVSGLQAYFLDNTDPDGIDWILHELRNHLGETLVIVISKSGGTVETRNGMLEVQNFFTAKGVDFAKQVVTITTKGSKLDQQAEAEGWLDRFYIWDWVGGRTSITSAVGLLPAILQDIDIDDFLQGARDCDETTRREEPLQNPASILALMWNYAVEKEHKKNMVVLPYRDSLQLFSRYLQQLVMESLGKEKDLENKIVQQGLTVYGNKGSTDQHAYVQQLLDGANDFFVVFIEVQQDRRVRSLFIEADITSGDYLKAFLEGTRKALLKKGRESLTLSLRELTSYTLGVLVALFERAVGLYAFLININAYHQPGVELGKKGANQYVELQRRVLQYLRSKQGIAFTPEEVAENLGLREETEFVYKLLEHLYLNKYHEVKKEKGISIFTGKYFI